MALYSKTANNDFDGSDADKGLFNPADESNINDDQTFTQGRMRCVVKSFAISSAGGPFTFQVFEDDPDGGPSHLVFSVPNPQHPDPVQQTFAMGGPAGAYEMKTNNEGKPFPWRVVSNGASSPTKLDISFDIVRGQTERTT